MKLTLAYSPCPNDTFAFHAMVHGLIDTFGIEFDVQLADVEQLNKSAYKEEFDICKLSYGAFFGLCDKYVMLRSGSALGFNNGPLLVCKSKKHPIPEELINYKIAIPGEHTTAALLLKIAYPQCKKITPLIFSDIEEAVLSGEYDAGLLIHEGRFTYQKKGLELIRDLGSFWQDSTGLPIPLGGIAIKREHLPIGKKINEILLKSIVYAFENPERSASYIGKFAQEMDPAVQKSHIDLYVNEFTKEIGSLGESAVKTLYEKASLTDFEIKQSTNLFIY